MGCGRGTFRGGSTACGRSSGCAPAGQEPFSTGAFAFLGTVVFESTRERKFFIAGFQYTAATRNDQGVTVGNAINTDVAAAYFRLPRPEQAKSQLGKVASRIARHGGIGVLELNGELQNRARTRTAPLPDAGGGTLLLSPGVQYFPFRNFLVEFSLPIPVVRE